MRTTLAKESGRNAISKAACGLLVLAGLALLVGCQGVSAGGSSQQSSTLSLGNATLSFGSVTAGSSKTLSISATNPGPASITVTSAAISTKYFSLTGTSLPVTLASGQSAPINVMFSPNAAGAFNATVTVTSNAANATATVGLSGTGIALGQLSSNPSSENFGSVTTGTQQSQTVTLTNTGGTSVNISQAVVAGAGFQLSGIATPLSLNPSQSTTMIVTFAPQSTGAAIGTLTVTSNASNPTLTIPLSGSGASPAGQLTPNPAAENFGSVTTGTQQSQTVTLTNTGGTSVNISQAAVTGTGFQLSGITAPLSLSPSQSTTLTVTFAPQSTGSATGTLTITSDAVNPTLTIPLSGTGISPGGLGSNPSSLSFGNVTLGSNKSLSETVTNTGGASVTISQVAVSGTGYSVSGISTPVTLAASQSATFNVIFTPATAASASGSVTVTSNASNPSLAVPLTGAGVSQGALGSNPSSLSFGNVTVGSNQSLSETVTNTGGTSLTISQVTVSGSGYSVSGISTPATLAPGQSATFSVKFAPTTAASSSGSVTVTSDASNPILTIPLIGTGVSPGLLGSNPTSLSFGNVTVGTNKTLSETITNTGGTSVTISQVTVSGTGFSMSSISTPLTLTSGQSASFSVTFAPLTATSVSGNVTVTSNASNPTLTIPLTGTGVSPGALGSNPTSLSFGSVTVGSNKSLSETVTNTGGASVTISQVAASGTGFSVSGVSTPLSLAAGQSATFSVTFTPTTATSVSGNVTVTSNASNPTLTIPLSGTGIAAVGHLTITPSTLGLGTVVVGTSGSASGTLTASGATVTVTGATTNNSVFSIGGLSLPVSIPAGQSVPFTITFSPLTTGTVSATLTVTSNAQPSTSTETLTGTGAPAPTHSVNLSWNASTSPNIAGYNVYRALYASTCGSFSRINTLLDTTTLYTDPTVTDGSSYCYAATAVDTNNAESGYSNIVSNVQIPAP